METKVNRTNKFDVREDGSFTITITDNIADLNKKVRLDIYLAEKLDISRSLASDLISEGFVFVNNSKSKSSYKIKNNDIITGRVKLARPVVLEPENISIEILYEDEHLAIVNKPAGMVVHPSPGHEKGTLVNALMFHFSFLSDGGDDGLRPGIVHRLDKDTSGAIIIAKNSICHEKLSSMFKERKIRKKYLALVYGSFDIHEGTIEKPIGRHPRDRKKMAVVYSGGRYSLSEWKVLKSFNEVSLVEIDLKTGRTHQIRVHMASEGHPLLGEPVYGFKHPLKHIKENSVRGLISKFAKRQMLHSHEIAFEHPFTGKFIKINAPVFEDMKALFRELEKYEMV